MPIYHQNSRLCLQCPQCFWKKESKHKGHSDCISPQLDLVEYSHCPKCQHEHLELTPVPLESWFNQKKTLLASQLEQECL